MNEFNDFVKMSHYVGGNLAFIQGGGGNTSVKISNQLMILKASGATLKDVGPDSGHVILNTEMYRHRILSEREKLTELAYSQIGVDSLQEHSGRPSIEACLHALIPFKYVIHSHSVYANVINCSWEGVSFIKDVFPDALYLNYETPGKELAKSLIGVETIPQIIFLENHGIVIAADSLEECIDLHEELSHKIKKKLNLPDELPLHHEQAEDYIFPDQVVFKQVDYSNNSFVEINAAANYVINEIARLGWRVRTLTEEKVNEILNLESEKYRIKVAQV